MSRTEIRVTGFGGQGVVLSAYIIGRASAILFGQLGASVVASDVNADGVHETVATIANAGGTAEASVVDVTMSSY